MTITVLRAGFFTTAQDLGRIGSRAHGVSLGGALDQQALRVANLLVGNEPSAAGLETTLGRIRFRFEDQRAIAWCGGAVQAELAGTPVPPGRAVIAGRGDELEIAVPERGARTWLAVSGGIDVPVLLGSRSTDLRAQFGGLEGRALRDGDILPLGEPSHFSDARGEVANWGAPEAWAKTGARRPFLRFTRGADWNRFQSSAHAAFSRGQFIVTDKADRMGVRLTGPTLARADAEDLISEAVAPGTIQVPPDGQPILLLGDCQTIGGYPKLAHVITVDMPIAAQLRPGDPVHFGEVPLEEARSLFRAHERDLKWFRAGVALRMR